MSDKNYKASDPVFRQDMVGEATTGGTAYRLFESERQNVKLVECNKKENNEY